MQIYALSSIHDIFWLQVQTSTRVNICLHTSEGQREGKFGQEFPCPKEKKAISQLLCFLGTAGQNQGLGFSVSLCSCFIAYLGCQKFPGGRGWLPCQRTDPSGLHFLGEASTKISLGRLTIFSQPAGPLQMLLSVPKIGLMALSCSLFFLPSMAHSERWKNTIITPSVELFLSMYKFLTLGFHEPCIILLQST